MEYTDYAVKVIYKKQADCINKKWTNDNILRKNDNILRKNDNILRKNDNILHHIKWHFWGLNGIYKILYIFHYRNENK